MGWENRPSWVEKGPDAKNKHLHDHVGKGCHAMCLTQAGFLEPRRGGVVPNSVLSGAPNSSILHGHRPEVREGAHHEVQGRPCTLATRRRRVSLCPV